MDENAFQLIPTDVIKAWSKGDYYIGDIPSISYRHLGIALLLRGWYTYVDITEGADRKEWAGVAKVDIKGSVLSMGGIRLFGKQAIFWRTEHSFIQDDTEIIWFYSGFNCDSSTQVTEIRNKYFRERNLKLDLPGQCFGMGGDNWKQLLKTLATDFDDDVERIAQAHSLKTEQMPRRDLERDLGMLRFKVNLDPNSNQRVRKCQYYHYDSSSKVATAGLAEFRKVGLEGALK